MEKGHSEKKKEKNPNNHKKSNNTTIIMFVWGVRSTREFFTHLETSPLPKAFHSFGDVTLTGEGL